MISKIIEQLVKKMGEEFPDAVRPVLANYIRESFKQGQNYRVAIKPHRKVLPKDAIRFFTDVMQTSIGQSFKNREDKFREAVKKILITGKRTEVIKELQQTLGGLVSDPGELKKMNWMLRDMLNRTRNYSRVDRFSQLGIAEVEVVAVLDTRTSAICKLMHGRRVKTEQAREFTKSFTSTDPVKVFEEFKSPPRDLIESWDGKSTSDIMKQLKLKLPPYHAGGCRTTVIASFNTKLTKRSGKKFQGKVEKPNFKRKRKPNRDKMQEINSRYDDLKNLTSEELLSKVDALKAATWDQELLEKHFKKHSEMGAKTAKDYQEVARSIIEKPDEIFAYVDEKASERRFGFRLKKSGHFVAVGYDSMRVHTLHKRYEHQIAEYLRIL